MATRTNPNRKVNSSKLGHGANSVEPAIIVGFVAIAVIYSFGDISGANFNPGDQSWGGRERDLVKYLPRTVK